MSAARTGPGVALALLAALVAVTPACGRKSSLEKAGRKADEAIEKASGAAKDAASRLSATATAAGAEAADRASRAGRDVKEGAQKVGGVVQETAENVGKDVASPRPTPTRAPPLRGPRRKPQQN